MTSSAHPTAAVLLAALLSACGSLSPPISIADSKKAPSADAPPELALEAVEGRPRGLMLQLRAEMELDPEAAIVVERRIADGATETIRTIELSPERIARIENDRLKFLDRSVVAGARHHYRLRYESPQPSSSEEAARTSPTLSLTWREPPPRPDQLEAEPIGATVELSWRPLGRGAAIFRRNVLADRSQVRRIATVGPGARGQFVDRSARPGGVYAYQVALARPDADFPQFGPPSEALYVSLSDEK